MGSIALEDAGEELEGAGAAPSEAKRSRVGAEVLRALRHGTNRAFLRTARWAPGVTTPLLETALTWCATSCDPTVRRRARYVLGYLRRAARS